MIVAGKTLPKIWNNPNRGEGYIRLLIVAEKILLGFGNNPPPDLVIFLYEVMWQKRNNQKWKWKNQMLGYFRKMVIFYLPHPHCGRKNLIGVKLLIT